MATPSRMATKRRTRAGQVVDAVLAVAFLLSLFVITAAVAGLWLGLAWRFVWVTAP